jgi:hypothetical protein
MQKSTVKKYPSVKNISDAQRVGMVKEVFSTITGRYDFLNHLLSLRRDIAWRRFAIKKWFSSKPTGFVILPAAREIYQSMPALSTAIYLLPLLILFIQW